MVKKIPKIIKVPVGNKLYRTPNGNAVFVTRDGHVTLTNQSNLKENQIKFVNVDAAKRCVYLGVGLRDLICVGWLIA